MGERILEYCSGNIQAHVGKQEKILVENVSFVLEDGKSLALIGETGSGKTMTALSIMKLLPENVRMLHGVLQFKGEKLKSKKAVRLLLGVDIVYIPQNGLEFLNPSKKIKYHLYDNLQKVGIKKSQMKQEAIRKLLQAGFENGEEILEKYPFQLSGGMAQRVTIAIAACSEAKLILADEPTNGLDFESKMQFMNLLNMLFPTAGRLIITHDITIAKLCDETLVLCGGKMMERGNSQELLKSPRHPYTKALLDSLVENGMCPTPVLRHEVGFCPFYKRCRYAKEVCRSSMTYQKDGVIEWWCCKEK